MATIKKFEDLDIWIDARRLSKEIIKIANATKLNTDYKLKEQIKSSSGSVMDNIAEGFERNGNAEFNNFLSIAKGSAGETRSQLYRIFDNEYIDEATLQNLKTEYEKLSVKIHNFMNYLSKNDFKGTKFIKKITNLNYLKQS